MRSIPPTLEEEMGAFERMNALEEKVAEILVQDAIGRKALLAVIGSKSMASAGAPTRDTIRRLTNARPNDADASRAIRSDDFVRTCFNMASRRARKAQAGPGSKKWKASFSKAFDALQKERNEFAAKNLRLVVMYANVYRRRLRCMTVSDLVQEGNSGLMRAVEKFDSSKGVKFSTYATWWIKQAIRRSLSEKDRSIRIPVHLSEAIGKYLTVAQAHLVKTGREITEAEAVEALGIPLSKVQAIRSIQDSSVVPMETHSVDYTEILVDQKAEDPLRKSISEETRQRVIGLLDFLLPREKEVIQRRFALVGREEKTLAEIGDQWNLSRERIRQIENSALSKLKIHARRMGMDGSI